MRILVTNDDGIDSIGLHVLARAMCALDGQHEVVVAAPDSEYSGASAAVGALQTIRPEVHRANIDDCPASAIWSISGPPALCVMFANLGAFGGQFDLVVAGINPGANVGRAVYHSGTVGAAMTARNGSISGVAVSQAVAGFGVEGQGWNEAVGQQLWDTAAEVAKTVVQALVDDLPEQPVLINVNVPNLPLEKLGAWRHGVIGTVPVRSMASATLEPIPDHQDAYSVKMSWGDPIALVEGTDGWAIGQDDVAISYISRLVHDDSEENSSVSSALDNLLR